MQEPFYNFILLLDLNRGFETWRTNGNHYHHHDNDNNHYNGHDYHNEEDLADQRYKAAENG